MDVLCVQELGLDVPSAPTFVSMAQGAGLHVFLGSAESGKHRVAVISRFAGKAVHMCSDRAAAACFQLLCNGSLTKVLISSFYGCVHDEDAAMAGARAAVLGELAAGLAFSWDAAFENETLLPGTRESGRRLDYALGCGRFFPTYEVPLECPAGLRSPTFRRLRSTEVSEEAWRAVWQAKDFEDELAAGLVNEAWVRLSDTAQDLLAEEGSHGPRRSQLWRPLTRAPQRSKATLPGAAVLVIQLRRLQRRLGQLLRFPGDQRLRDKAGRQICALCPKVPWLGEVPFLRDGALELVERPHRRARAEAEDGGH